ncbi:MAG: hypothetical protein ACXVR9_08955 [Gaiellaceae bacterium]
MARFILTVEGSNFQELDEIELPRPPADGDPIETNLGTCLVLRTEPLDDASQYSGRIVCRLP